MKRFLLVLLLVLFPISLDAQVLVRSRKSSTSAVAGNTVKIVNTRPTFHRLVWHGEGTVTTCTVKVEQSSDGSAWSDLIAAQTCTSNGSEVVVSGIINYVRINITVLTGGGTLTASYEGLSGDGCGILYTGNILSITGSDPAAGAAMTETVPAGVIWRFISMNVTLVTDGNVANRTVHFLFDDGTNIYLRVTNDQGQAENLTQIYAVANGVHTGFISPNIQSLPSPADLFLPAGHRIREGVDNFQAGDNWGAPQLLVEECPLN